MLIAINDDGIKCPANRANKNMRHICPVCFNDVIIRHGEKNIPHFSHMVKSQCAGSGESEDHVNMKIDIIELLGKYGVVAEQERRITTDQGTRIADVYFESDGHKFAVEVQLSKQNTEAFRQRTRAYTSAGIKTLWVTSAKMADTWWYERMLLSFGDVWVYDNQRGFSLDGKLANIAAGWWGYMQGGIISKFSFFTGSDTKILGNDFLSHPPQGKFVPEGA